VNLADEEHWIQGDNSQEGYLTGIFTAIWSENSPKYLWRKKTQKVLFSTSVSFTDWLRNSKAREILQRKSIIRKLVYFWMKLRAFFSMWRINRWWDSSWVSFNFHFGSKVTSRKGLLGLNSHRGAISQSRISLLDCLSRWGILLNW